MWKNKSAKERTTIFAANVNPFLLFAKISLFLLEKDKLFTIAMWEIWTQAQPILEKAGRIKYQAFLPFSENPAYPLVPLTNGGYEKIPIKQGMTTIVPKIYQGILWPHLVVILSLSNPTIGVMIPSAIWPEKRHYPVTLASSRTTLLRYHER